MLETMQNNALGTIFKIKQKVDHVSIESLREKAKIESIKERHMTLI